MLLTLDKAPGKPLAAQIRAQLLELLGRGTLRVGECLPSTRQLAEQLGVHRTTVAEAYQELWSLGWLELRPGSRARVRSRTGLAPARPGPAAAGACPTEARTDPAATDAFPWAAHMGGVAQGLVDRAARPAPVGDGVISFRSMTMDPRLIPAETFRGCLARVLRRRGAALLGYGAREGFRPLREYLARRLAGYGIQAGPDEILLTHGSQQALDLVFRMLGPGRRIALENPSYEQVFLLLELAGQTPVPVPMGRDGLDLDALEACCERDPPALLYTMPNFHNPMGISTSQSHRERLLALCGRFGVPILEDGFEEEMKYFGRVTLPIKSMDRRGGVIYCGTFSKVLLPGIRVGWLVAPPTCIRTLAALRRVSELCPDQVLPAALHAFCESGHYDLHLSRMHRVFRSRLRAALAALREFMPPGRVRWQEPVGGYLLWLELSGPADLDWEAHCAAHGVEVCAGSRFFLGPAPATRLRLSISTLDEAQIREGLRRLGQAIACSPGPEAGR